MMDGYAQIRLLVMDVDGTLTDGKIYMGANGELMKAFDIKDGCGIKDILPRYGILPVIITARSSPILEHRCRELDVQMLYQGVREKLQKLEEILNTLTARSGTPLSLQNVAYIGDDILDLQCMEPIRTAGGLVGCPADAVAEVRAAANFISTKPGGNGAVREFIEWLTNRFS